MAPAKTGGRGGRQCGCISLAANSEAKAVTPFGWSASLTGRSATTEAAGAPVARGSFLELYDAIPDADIGGRVGLLSVRLQTDWRNLFAELRRDRPVFVTPFFTMITRRGDVLETLSQHELFSVRGYQSKMDPSVGPFMLARDETELNWHDKALMRSLLRLGDLPQIRQIVADAVRDAAGDGQTIELVSSVGRLAPLRVVQRYFGFPGPDDATMLRWSRASQADMFRNPTNEPAVHAANVQAGQEMQAYVRRLLDEKRSRSASGETDAIARLLRIAAADELGMSVDRVVSNVCGLLVGAIETASQAIVHATEQILSRPDVKAQAIEAAKAEEHGAFDAIVWEALRFNPMTTLVFRFCERDTVLAPGAPYATPIKQGAVVAACTGSAMLDGDAIPDVDAFRPGRPADVYMHLGFGHHECLGKYVGMAMVPEAVRQVLLFPAIELIEGEAGRIDFQNGPFPERFAVRRAPVRAATVC